jgi:hypothetical protein
MISGSSEILIQAEYFLREEKSWKLCSENTARKFFPVSSSEIILRSVFADSVFGFPR